jgi:hypothetical protein
MRAFTLLSFVFLATTSTARPVRHRVTSFRVRLPRRSTHIVHAYTDTRPPRNMLQQPIPLTRTYMQRPGLMSTIFLGAPSALLLTGVETLPMTVAKMRILFLLHLVPVHISPLKAVPDPQHPIPRLPLPMSPMSSALQFKLWMVSAPPWARPQTIPSRPRWTT